MTKPALPRFRMNVTLEIELSARDGEDALARRAAIEAFIGERLGKSTFARLPGKPTCESVQAGFVVIDQSQR